MTPRFRQTGLTLVELLVALAVGLLLTAGVGSIFISSKQGYRSEDALARLQENGRFAIELMSQNLRLAGYMGCASVNSVEPSVIASNPPPEVTFTADTVITGDDGSNGAPDAVSVRFASPQAAQLTADIDPSLPGTITAEGSTNFSVNDTLVIADCSSADIFRAADVNTEDKEVTIEINGGGGGGEGENGGQGEGGQNLTNEFSKTYRTDALVMALESMTFQIQNNGQGVPSLYQKTLKQTEQLVAGVEDMQIRYGVDSDQDGSVDQYLDADQVNHWDRVNSVRLALLLRTVDEVNPEPVPYNFQFFQNNAPGDRFLRREFVATVNLRNRSP